MKILFDLTALQPLSGTFHGAGEYTKAVLRGLLSRRRDQEIIGFFDPRRWLDPEIEALLERERVERRAVRHHAELERVVQQEHIDRVFSGLPYHYYGVDFGDAEVVFTVHGLRPIELPTDKYEARYDPRFKVKVKHLLKSLLRPVYVSVHRRRFGNLLRVRAKKRTFVVVSCHTKFSLISTFPTVDMAELKMFYSPRRSSAEVRQEVDHSVLSGYGVQERGYFLLVSGGRWVKNAHRAVQALDSIYDDFPHVAQKVIITGIERPDTFRRRVRHKERFILKGYVPSEELEALYRHAFCLVYPTLNEGFGYPPLECMGVGTPVVCSGVTSVTEVCGAGPLYFDPYSRAEMRNRILTLLFDPDCWKECAKRGKERSEAIAARQDEMLTQLCDLILREADQEESVA